MDRFKQQAFTLAEVLITLGIIGVVTALTLPTLVKTYERKQLETAFKKSYSDIGRLVGLISAEIGTVPTTETIDVISLRLIIRKKLPKVKDCGISTTNISCLGIDTTFADWLSKSYKRFDGQTSLGVHHMHWSLDDGMFILSDGRLLFLDNSVVPQTYIFSIDTNGLKKPNRFGYDLFMFCVNPTNGKIGGCSGGNPTVTRNWDCTAVGYGCANKTLENPEEYFKNLQL